MSQPVQAWSPVRPLQTSPSTAASLLTWKSRISLPLPLCNMNLEWLPISVCTPRRIRNTSLFSEMSVNHQLCIRLLMWRCKFLYLVTLAFAILKLFLSDVTMSVTDPSWSQLFSVFQLSARNFISLTLVSVLVSMLLQFFIWCPPFLQLNTMPSFDPQFILSAALMDCSTYTYMFTSMAISETLLEDSLGKLIKCQVLTMNFLHYCHCIHLSCSFASWNFNLYALFLSMSA